MTIDHNQNGDAFAASGDSKHRLKIEYLAGIHYLIFILQYCFAFLFEDEICRLLFGDSTNLLDDIFNHPLSIDYFNIYLSLPVNFQKHII